MTSTALTLHTVNEEQLVLDTDLAERLGMAAPRNVRAKIIATNMTELLSHGPLCTRTDKAAAVRKLVIDTFMTVPRGNYPSPLATASRRVIAITPHHQLSQNRKQPKDP